MVVKQTILQQMSLRQQPSGSGKGLLQNNTLTQLGVPVILGQSPGPGTSCTFFLATGADNAYFGAQVDFIVMQFGRSVIFSTQFITAAIFDNNRQCIELSAGNCAADYWEVQITLNHGTLPQKPTQSSILATGVENLGAGTGTEPNGALVFSTTATGPSATGTASFAIPSGTTVWQVTGVARVLVPGGGSEAAGDSYSVSVPVTWNLTGAAARLVAATAGTAFVSTDTDMSTTTFVAGATGANATVLYTLPSGLDAGTTVLVTITLLPMDLG